MSVDGIEDGDTVNVTYTLVNFKQADVYSENQDLTISVDNTNYQVPDTVSVPYTINPVKITRVAVTTESRDYDKDDYTATIDSIKFYSQPASAEKEITGLERGKDYSLEVDELENNNAGTQSVTYTVTLSNTNYSFGGADPTKYDGETTVVINKIVVTAPEEDPAIYTYNGEEQTYQVAASDKYSVSGNKQTNAGDHTVTISLNDPDNYEWNNGLGTDNLEYTFTINPQVLHISGAIYSPYPRVYEAGNKTVNIDKVTFEGEVKKDDVAYTVVGEKATMDSDTPGDNTATYTVNLPEDGNYIFVNEDGDRVFEQEATVSVYVYNKVVPVPNPKQTEFTYDGEEHNVGDATEDYSAEDNVKTDAGNYTAIYTLTGENTAWEGAEFGHATDPIKIPWEIKKAPGQVYGPDNVWYDETQLTGEKVLDFPYELPAGSEKGLQFSIDNQTGQLCTAEIDQNTGTITITMKDEYHPGNNDNIYVTIKSDNYEDSTYTLRVNEPENPKTEVAFEIPDQSKEYDAQPVTPHDIVFKDKKTGDEIVIPEEDLVYTYKDKDGNVLPNPPINAGGYILNISVKESAPNYRGASEPAKFSINPKSVQIIGKTVVRNAGDPKPVLDEIRSEVYSVDGFIEPDTFITGPNLSYVTEPAEMLEPGIYDINIENAVTSTNYTVDYSKANAKLLVPKSGKNIEISGISVDDKTYDGLPVEYTGEFKATYTDPETGEEFDVTDQFTEDEITYTYYKVDPVSGDRAKLDSAPKDAGNYLLEINAENDNFIGSEDITFEIYKKPLTITGKTINANVGDPIPDLTKIDHALIYDIDGLIGTDTLDTLPKLAYKSIPDMSKAGEYEIVISDAEAANYEIEYTNAKLVVTDQPGPIPTPDPDPTPSPWDFGGDGSNLFGVGNYGSNSGAQTGDPLAIWMLVAGMLSMAGVSALLYRRSRNN